MGRGVALTAGLSVSSLTIIDSCYYCRCAAFSRLVSMLLSWISSSRWQEGDRDGGG